MKDATGELSMTAVAVVAIAAIAVVFTTLIWPRIKINIMRSTYCSQAFNCGEEDTETHMKQCSYCTNTNDDAQVTDPTDANCGTVEQIDCPAQ